MRHLPSAVTALCLLDDVDEKAIQDWTSSKAAPVAIRAYNLLREVGMDQLEIYPQLMRDVFPPWQDIPNINLSFQEEPTQILMNRNIAQLFQILKTDKYQNTTHIYTDGSRSDNASRVEAAMFVPEERLKLAWKLPFHYSVFTGKGYAIYQA